MPAELMTRIASGLSAEERAEMAVPSYLHANPAMRWMAWRRLEVVEGRIARALRARVDPLTLDFGCGTGVLFESVLARSSRLYGVDLVLGPARQLVAERKLSGVELLPPESLEGAIPPGSVDLVVAAEVLEHLAPLGLWLGRFRQVLRADGVLVVSLPTENALYRLGRRLAGFSGQYHRSNAASIDGEIRASGFRRRYRCSIPAPGPLAIYWIAEYVLL